MEKKAQQQSLPSIHKVSNLDTSSNSTPPSGSEEQIVQMKFDSELKKMGQSWWFAMILMLMCAPSVCNVVLYMVFAKISNLDFKTRCRIPLLENKHWSFEQMQRITAPLDEKLWNCTYCKYNYTAIAKMYYWQALKYIKKIKHPEIVACRKFVHEGGSIYSIYKEFSLICNRVALEEILNIAPVCGQIIASIFIVPLADLLGRKRVVKWGVNLFIAGALVICTANTAEILIIGRGLVGMAYVLTIYPIEATVVEISSKQLRPLHFVMVHIGTGIGFIAVSLLATKIWNWHLLQWTVSSVLLILPLTTWYMPESPHWLMSKRKEAEAWTIMKTLKDPTKQSDLVLVDRNEKRNCWAEIKTHVIEYKPFYAKLRFLMLLAVIAAGVYFKSLIVRFQMKLDVSRSDYFMMSGIAEIISYVLCVPLLLIFGRRPIMGFLLLSSGLAYLIVAQLELGTASSLIFILITELTTSAIYITSLLYINEIAPTSHRCTTTGIAHGFAGGLSNIVVFYIYSYSTADKNQFIFLSCLCLVGVPVALFADETQNKDLHHTVEETILP